MWQNWFISIAQWVFLAALIPTIRSKTEKPALLTCVITSTTVTGFVPTYYSMGLIESALCALLLACAWWLITFQRYQLNRANARP